MLKITKLPATGINNKSNARKRNSDSKTFETKLNNAIPANDKIKNFFV